MLWQWVFWLYWSKCIIAYRRRLPKRKSQNIYTYLSVLFFLSQILKAGLWPEIGWGQADCQVQKIKLFILYFKGDKIIWYFRNNIMLFSIDFSYAIVQIICDYSPWVDQTFGKSTKNDTKFSIVVANSHYQLPGSEF